MNKRDTGIFIRSLPSIIIGFFLVIFYGITQLPHALKVSYQKFYKVFYDPFRTASCRRYPHVWGKCNSPSDEKTLWEIMQCCKYCGALIPKDTANMTEKTKKELGIQY